MYSFQMMMDCVIEEEFNIPYDEDVEFEETEEMSLLRVGRCCLGVDDLGFELLVLRKENDLWSYDCHVSCVGNITRLCSSPSFSGFPTREEALVMGLERIKEVIANEMNCSNLTSASYLQIDGLLTALQFTVYSEE